MSVKRWLATLLRTLFFTVLGFLFFKGVQYWRRLLKQPYLLTNQLPADLDNHQTIEAKGLRIAAANLLSGIEKRWLLNGQQKLVLCAGLRNFREPWARDFGFASFGLIELGELQAVKESLEVF